MCASGGMFAFMQIEWQNKEPEINIEIWTMFSNVKDKSVVYKQIYINIDLFSIAIRIRHWLRRE